MERTDEIISERTLINDVMYAAAPTPPTHYSLLHLSTGLAGH